MTGFQDAFISRQNMVDGKSIVEPDKHHAPGVRQTGQSMQTSDGQVDRRGQEEEAMLEVERQTSGVPVDEPWLKIIHRSCSRRGKRAKMDTHAHSEREMERRARSGEMKRCSLGDVTEHFGTLHFKMVVRRRSRFKLPREPA